MSRTFRVIPASKPVQCAVCTFSGLLQVQGFSLKTLISLALIIPQNGLWTLIFLCFWYSQETLNNNDNAQTCEAESKHGDTAADSLISRLNKEQIEMAETHYAELDFFRKELPDDLIIYAIDAAIAKATPHKKAEYRSRAIRGIMNT